METSAYLRNKNSKTIPSAVLEYSIYSKMFSFRIPFYGFFLNANGYSGYEFWFEMHEFLQKNLKTLDIIIISVFFKNQLTVTFKMVWNLENSNKSIL